MAIDLIAELGTFPLKAVSGSIRYLLSSKFRNEKHEEWKTESAFYVAGVVVFSAAFTLVTFGAILYLVFQIAGTA